MHGKPSMPYLGLLTIDTKKWRCSEASGGSWELGIQEAPDAYYASYNNTEGDDRGRC